MEYKQVDFKVQVFGDEEGTFSGVASTYRNKDLQGEIVDSGAFASARGATILWAHDTHEVLGSTRAGESQDGLNIDASLDLEVQRAREAYSLLKKKHVSGLSVGYIVTKDYYKDGVRHIAEAQLKEVSITAFPANPQAMVTDVKDEKVGRVLSAANVSLLQNARDAIDALLKAGVVATAEDTQELETKAAIPYEKTALAPPTASWDGPGEVSAATIDDMPHMCAWVEGDGSTKDQYKLPHHTASKHLCVWAGVAGSGAALMGARGGVQIPKSDVPDVKAHLEKHYKEFGKVPPWIATQDAAQFTKMLTEINEEIKALME